VNILPGDNCAILYGSDPHVRYTTHAVEICGKVGAPSSKFTYAGLTFNYGLYVDKIGDGISYVTTGSLATLTMFSGKSLDGDELILRAGGSFLLSNYYDPDAPKGISWDDVPLSFELKINNSTATTP
jgi:hypothetical protein